MYSNTTTSETMTTFIDNVSSTMMPPSFNTSNNTSNDTGEPTYARNEFLAKLEISVLAIILYMALFGNIVVIAVLLYRRRKLSRMQLFIIHLAIADISVALFQVLPQLIMDITFRFDGNNFLCKLVKYFQVATMYSSTYVLIMTALDRYMSICHPLTSQTWTSRRVHVMVLIAWLLSGLFSIPQLVLFTYKKRYDGVMDCLDNFDLVNAFWELQAYITWIFVSLYAVPLIVLTGCYTKICYVVWVSVNARENPSNLKKKKSWGIYKKSCSQENGTNSPKNIVNPRAHSKRLSKSKIKTIKLTLAVVICFLVCWAPFFITQMWSAFDMNAPYYTSHIMAITTLLASLNSCTNPWIYLAFSGRVCKRERRLVNKTWTSTNNTYMMDTMENSRMRGHAVESVSLTRSSHEKEMNRIADDI